MALTVAHGGSPPLDVIRELLKHPSIDVNAPRGWSPLMKAARFGHAEAVALLLQHPGINVNAIKLKAASPRDGLDGFTSLHLAAQYGHLSVVRELLKHPGMDLGLRNRHGMTAHQLAEKREGNGDVVGAIAAAMAH